MTLMLVHIYYIKKVYIETFTLSHKSTQNKQFGTKITCIGGKGGGGGGGGGFMVSRNLIKKKEIFLGGA